MVNSAPEMGWGSPFVVHNAKLLRYLLPEFGVEPIKIVLIMKC